MINLNTIEEAIRIQFPNYSGPVTQQTSAIDISGWDSVAHVQLMLLIEEISGTEVDIGATMSAKNIAELIFLFDKG
ncbi:hypothetical protein [Rhizobium sp.]|jgi:acyl carrier protein|uniref:hypothetical protein n=1 Tax=Rhizobium sp. TaxID=391 RepID=UPI000E7E8F57|nr:acyl carrier protein [Rhizobium sp.]